MGLGTEGVCQLEVRGCSQNFLNFFGSERGLRSPKICHDSSSMLLLVSIRNLKVLFSLPGNARRGTKMLCLCILSLNPILPEFFCLALF